MSFWGALLLGLCALLAIRERVDCMYNDVTRGTTDNKKYVSKATGFIPFSPSSSKLPVIVNRQMRRKMIPLDGELEGWTPPPAAADYVFVPPEVGPEIYAGSIIAIIPIVWATFEFTSRIRTQQQCLACNGSGLVYVTKQGNPLNRPRKCWSCGGFIPWLGWRMFFLSTFFDVGNGGVLQRPAKDYKQNNERIRKERESGAAEPSNADK